MSPWLHMHQNTNWTFPWFIGVVSGVNVAVCEECSASQGDLGSRKVLF